MVLKPVPPNCTVVGVPGRIVKRTDNAGLPCDDLNQTDLPDPVRDDINNLKHTDTEITNHVIELELEVRELKRELERCRQNRQEGS